ncbi:MAG: hypothetical protein EON59_02980 [Alphaproteobacteria bacterium]|nr:MAG: hypothetical protein EON59_02980 [Alphaproteobacteria bacterium]
MRMQTALQRPALVLAMLALSVNACDKKPAVQEQDVAAVEGAPALDAGARDAAIGLITDDLNRPFAELQAKLSEAVYEGLVSPSALWLPAVGDVAWWYWAHGYVTIAPGGSTLALTEKGQRFVDEAPPTWLQAAAIGSPTMACESAGSLTSAACRASVQYETRGVTGSEMAQVTLPPTAAHLEAAFAPGSGWSVSNVSVDGDVPHDAVRALLFGESSNAASTKTRFDSAMSVSAAAPSQPENVEPDEPEVVERGPSFAVPPASPAKTPSVPAIGSPSTRAPAIITAPVWSRSPTAEELRAVYPSSARSRNVSGRSDLECAVTAEGTLTSCTATGEFPPGSRFGQAGVAASRFYVMAPQQASASPRVRFSINWPPQ